MVFFYKNIKNISKLSSITIRFIYLKSKSWGPYTGFNKVKLVEISPRVSLQHTKQEETKINFINQLSKTGLKVIEMDDTYELMTKVTREAEVDYTATVSNIHELNRAIIANVKDVSIFSSASETFCKKNLNCSIKESLAIYRYLVDRANAENIAVRGHISCVLGCPYEGEVRPSTVAKIAEKMYKMGCYEISLGDTMGVGTPGSMFNLLNIVKKHMPIERIAVHCSDTYGQALANIYCALKNEIRVFDSSIAGLAEETISTEDIVYMLNGLNYYTGVSLEKMIGVGNYISQYLNIPNKSKVAIAIANNKPIE